MSVGSELSGVQRLTVILLSSPARRTRERLGYVAAFQRAGYAVVEWLPRGITGSGLVDLARNLEGDVLVLNPEQEAVLPGDLLRVETPTGCFQIDTFRYPARRALWSLAFDHAFVFHPAFEDTFYQAGHRSVTLLPHAVDVSHYVGLGPQPRIYELGWVGTVNGALNSRRRRLLPRLAKVFKMNEWNHRYPESAASRVYQLSRVVVNVGRDDWPQDANLRVFQAMAAGALLVTSLPSELVALGFVPGRHFVGYTDERDLEGLVRELLTDEPKRSSIAECGRELVLREHTYDRRVAAILSVVSASGFRASRQRVSQRIYDGIRLDYCLAHRALGEALRIACSLAPRAPLRTSRILWQAVRRRARALL
jgi:hypothetical protein